MKVLRRFFARLSSLAAGSRADQRLLEEMEEHLAQQTADNVRAGMPAAERVGRRCSSSARPERSVRLTTPK